MSKIGDMVIVEAERLYNGDTSKVIEEVISKEV